MSIRALFYITGDTQQSGFRCIGGSEAFPADDLPWLNNGEPIQQRARVEPGSSHQGYGGNRVLSHVWEYQTGRYGHPVMINTVVAIGTGRAHGFSEYVAGTVDNVAEVAEAGAMIAGTEAFDLLDADRFMEIPGRETVDCPETEWVPAHLSGSAFAEERGIDETWKKTVLFHYWKQASVRAFSEDSPSTVRVNLGDFSDDMAEDTEETIRQAKRFFAEVIAPGLPKQVQNIASMAAGVNCEDRCTLYTALEFDISFNMYAEETLQLERPRDMAEAYRLNEAEMEFITEVSSGVTPEAVSSFFDRYRALTGKTDIPETRVPFMADSRVWYLLWSMDRLIRERQAFIEKARLTEEQGGRTRLREARACFLLMRQLRRLLENDHHLNEENRTLVGELTGPLETALLEVMLEDMNRDGAEAFLLRRNEMVEFHRRTLYTVPDGQLDSMIALAARDAAVSRAPQFVRCYPATPIRNEAADERNGKLLAALLPASIRKRIDEECKKDTIEDKYLDQLRSEEFADNWACLNHCVKTKAAIADFLREEIRNSQKHFLLYKISLKYLPENELLLMTLKHLTDENTRQTTRPDERRLKIAAHAAREYIANPSGIDPDCVSAMNRYYQACFREYRANIGNISQDIIRRLGGDTTEAMTLIFAEYTEGTPLTPEEAAAVFEAFGGENKALARREAVRSVYAAMLEKQRDQALASPESDRNRLIRWLGGMVAAAPFDTDTTETLKKIFIDAEKGERMRPADADVAFTAMAASADGLHSTVQRAYTDMLSVRRKEAVEQSDRDGFTWLCDMADRSPWAKSREYGDWLGEQHTENVGLLCAISGNTGEPIDGSSLGIIRSWLDEGSLTGRGVTLLQRYCDEQLAAENPGPAEMMVRSFSRIDDSCPALRLMVFESAVKRLRDGLGKPGASLGLLIGDCLPDVEKAGRRVDELYEGAQETVDGFVRLHFESTADLNTLIEEQKQIPESCAFARTWQEHMDDKVYDQQIVLFNAQPNLEKLISLKEEILRRSTRLQPALDSAYRLIDDYERSLERLKDSNEYQAVTSLGRELQNINTRLTQASEVRKTLCSCLRNVKYPALEEMRGKSFRHALCATIAQAVLTDNERDVVAPDGSSVRGCPDWNKVLNSLFTKAELDAAVRKPYASANLKILQRLLSTVENVRIMTAYGMNEAWLSDLLRCIRAHSDLHQYQAALARNRKKSEQYHLAFDTDGLRFDLESP